METRFGTRPPPSPACAAPAGAGTHRRPRRRFETGCAVRLRRRPTARARGATGARARAACPTAKAPCARCFEQHQRAHLLVHATFRDVREGHAEAVEVLLRKVDAVLAPVDRHVLPEVGELQAGADRVAPSEVVCALAAIQREQQAPHGICRARAVVQHVGVRRIALGRDVLAKSRDQRMAERNRQLVSANRVRKIEKGASPGVSPRAMASSAAS